MADRKPAKPAGKKKADRKLNLDDKAEKEAKKETAYGEELKREKSVYKRFILGTYRRSYIANLVWLDCLEYMAACMTDGVALKNGMPNNDVLHKWQEKHRGATLNKDLYGNYHCAAKVVAGMISKTPRGIVGDYRITLPKWVRWDR